MSQSLHAFRYSLYLNFAVKFASQNIIAVSCKCGDGWFNYLLPVVFPNNGDTTSFPAFTTVQLRSRDLETTIVWKPEPLSLSTIMGQISKFGLSANITLARLKLKPGREDQEGWDRKGTRRDRGDEWGMGDEHKALIWGRKGAQW